MGAPANLPSIRDANASLGAITSQEMQKDAKMAKKKDPEERYCARLSGCFQFRCDLEEVVKQ